MNSLASGLPFHAELPPLRADQGGVVRIGNSRISLDLIVEQYENGMTPEGMVRAYDTLALADVHAVIAYYLRHKEEVRAYLKRREEEAQALREKIEAERARISGEELRAPHCQGEGRCCAWQVTPTFMAKSSAACAAVRP